MKRVAMACGLAWALSSAGCTALMVAGAGAAGVAGYAYLEGKREKTYPYPITQTWPAVSEAVKSLELPVLQETADGLGARLEGRTAQGEKVAVTLTPKGDATEVQIRVGVFGDENASELILAAIEERLPSARLSGSLHGMDAVHQATSTAP